MNILSDMGELDISQYHDNDSIKKNMHIKDVNNKVTNIIKDNVQLLFMFNYDFCENYKTYTEYSKPYQNYAPHDHRLILPDWISPIIKAGILETLSREQFIDMMNNKHLMQEVLPYLNDKLFMEIILTFVDSITIPILLKSSIFLTDTRVNSLMKNGAMYYGIEYHHLIANVIDPFDPLSVKLISPMICPKSIADIKLVLQYLQQYIMVPVYKSLEVKMLKIFHQRCDASNTKKKSMLGRVLLSGQNQVLRLL